MQGSKIEQQRKNLVNMGVLAPDEELYGSSSINYAEKLVGKFGVWRQGGAVIFTDRRLILSKGVSGQYIYIPYDCIKRLEKCNQGFFPIGLVITYEDRETKEMACDKISFMKRKKWLGILSDKTGLPCL